MTDPRAFYDALNAASIEYAGFSCNGVNLFGNREDVAALKRWHHDAGTVAWLKSEIVRQRAEITSKSEQIGKLYRVCNERDVLRLALERVLVDIEDYERANNLAPNPGRKYCWDSVAAAHAALSSGERPE